jgi:PilZ domain
LSDVSQSGACLVLDRDEQLPDRFVLLLSANGGAQRRCEVIWRHGTKIGVKFALD